MEAFASNFLQKIFFEGNRDEKVNFTNFLELSF